MTHPHHNPSFLRPVPQIPVVPARFRSRDKTTIDPRFLPTGSPAAGVFNTHVGQSGLRWRSSVPTSIDRPRTIPNHHRRKKSTMMARKFVFIGLQAHGSPISRRYLSHFRRALRRGRMQQPGFAFGTRFGKSLSVAVSTAHPKMSSRKALACQGCSLKSRQAKACTTRFARRGRCVSDDQSFKIVRGAATARDRGHSNPGSTELSLLRAASSR